MRINKTITTEHFDLELLIQSRNNRTHSLMGENTETLGIIIDEFVGRLERAVVVFEQNMKKKD